MLTQHIINRIECDFVVKEKGEGITQIHFNILANRVLDSDADCAFLYTFYLPFLLQKIER